MKLRGICILYLLAVDTALELQVEGVEASNDEWSKMRRRIGTIIGVIGIGLLILSSSTKHCPLGLFRFGAT